MNKSSNKMREGVWESRGRGGEWIGGDLNLHVR